MLHIFPPIFQLTPEKCSFMLQYECTLQCQVIMCHTLYLILDDMSKYKPDRIESKESIHILLADYLKVLSNEKKEG